MYAVIHTIRPFNALIGTTINFAWDGNQIFKIKCSIKDNETGSIVYTNTIDSMKSSYLLSGNIGLVNGKYYVANITVFDSNGVESEASPTGVPFYCYSTPTFKLSINQDDIIRSSTYKVTLKYAQTENEEIDFYNISLYSYQNTSLQTSGNIYDTSELSYVISGLENATQYYIRATGETIHGYALDTGLILFTTDYIQSTVFSTLELNNRPENGCIEVKSNILSAEGVPEKEVVYLDGTKADLRDNSVTFDIAFIVQGDFEKVLIFEKPNLNAKITTFSNKSGTMIGSLYYREGNYTSSNGKKSFMELSVSYCGLSYVIMSNFIPIPNQNQQIILYLSRKGNLYEMKLLAKDKEV